MTGKKWLYALIIFLLCAMLFSGCSAAEDFSLRGSSVFGGKLTLGLGNQAQIFAVDAEGADAEGIEWSSADAEIAQVNEEGVVTGTKEGTTTILARNSKYSHEVEVTVVFAYYSLEYIEAGSQTELHVAADAIDDKDTDTVKTYWEPQANASIEEKVLIITLSGDSKRVGYGEITFLDTSANNIASGYEVYVSDSITFENSLLISQVSGNTESFSTFSYSGEKVGKYIKIAFTELPVEGGSYPKVQDIRFAYSQK